MDNKPEDSKAHSDTFSVKRVLWCSDPDWRERYLANGTVDYYADTLRMLCDGDNNHCLELKVGGMVTRMAIKNPWGYV